VPSDPVRRKRIKRGQRVAFRLTRQERDLIVERTFVDAEIEGRLRDATSSKSNLIVDLTLDDVADLAGHVAAGANHCSEAGVRRALDAVYDRLANIEDTLTDEDDEAADALTHEAKPFTPKQRQYLAFIYYYTKIHGRAPNIAQRESGWTNSQTSGSSNATPRATFVTLGARKRRSDT